MLIYIYGKVQNVGFRFYTRRKAKETGITGFVRNQPDGSVYVEAEGQPEKLDEFISWCKTGPPWANVKDISVQDCTVQDFKDFTIK